MTAKASDTNFSNAVKDYVAGESIEVCAARWHTSVERLTDFLKTKGLLRDRNSRYAVIGKKITAAALTKLSLPISEIVDRFNAGESVNNLAKSYGVSRRAIEARLKSVDVVLRGQYEANILALSQIPHDDLVRRIGVAQEATRGVKHTSIHRAKIAKTRELRGLYVSPTETLLASWLVDRGISVIQQKAVGPYNVDIATFPVAVEVLGGSWHANKPTHPTRSKYIFDAGWHLVFVWVHAKRNPLTPAVADYIVAMLQEVSSDPTAIREYRVIRGDGKELSRGSADADNFTIVVPGYHGVGGYTGN